MAASSIFFNGRLISVPGSYSEVDASGLESVGLSAAGIVAVLGTGEGGRPVSDIMEPSQFLRANKPEKMRELFRSGDLREVSGMLFEPAKDSAISGGAVEVVAMKVNPSTKSYLTLDNAQGPALELESEDYGAFTKQIKVSISTGTNKGKLIAVEFEDQVESQDDIGGDAMFSLSYDKPTNGWDTMTAQVVAGGSVECEATRAGVAGKDGDVGTPLAAPGVIEVVAGAGDEGLQVTVYGLDGTGAPKAETLTTINGTVVGAQIFAAGDVLGAKVVGTSVGAITVKASPGGATIFTIPSGVNPSQGITFGVTMYVSGSKVTLVSSGASTKDVILVGKGANGAVLLEKITLTGVVSVQSVGNFAEITAFVLGDYEAGQTLTITAQAAKTTPAVQNALLKVVDFFNARFIDSVGGFVAALLTGRTAYPVTQLDVMAVATNILDPAVGEFYADLYAVIEYLNQSNTLIDATAAVGASGGAPSNTVTPQFMDGGSEGTPDFMQYQNALNLLKRTRVNSVVVLTGDPAVHAALDAHCAYMGGIGRSERDGFVGLLNTAQTDVVAKDEIKAQIVDLNTRHLALGLRPSSGTTPLGSALSSQPHSARLFLQGCKRARVLASR